MGKMAAMQVAVLSDTLEEELAKAASSEAGTLSTTTREEMQSFLVEHHPTINLKATKHNDKLVARAVLLENGQELTLDKFNRATRMVGKGPKGSDKGGSAWQHTCAIREGEARTAAKASTATLIGMSTRKAGKLRAMETRATL